jgi:hypothetical protein
LDYFKALLNNKYNDSKELTITKYSVSCNEDIIKNESGDMDTKEDNKLMDPNTFNIVIIVIYHGNSIDKLNELLNNTNISLSDVYYLFSYFQCHEGIKVCIKELIKNKINEFYNIRKKSINIHINTILDMPIRVGDGCAFQGILQSCQCSNNCSALIKLSKYGPYLCNECVCKKGGYAHTKCHSIFDIYRYYSSTPMRINLQNGSHVIVRIEDGYLYVKCGYTTECNHQGKFKIIDTIINVNTIKYLLKIFDNNNTDKNNDIEDDSDDFLKKIIYIGTYKEGDNKKLPDKYRQLVKILEFDIN